MDCHFFFGPDKTSFSLNDNGVVGGIPATPFHGIISKGLLHKLRENNFPPEVWHKNAHLLEREKQNDIKAGKDITMLEEFAVECNVLSFSQSALCAKMYLEDYLKDRGVKECEAWNVKEGHISSVWNVTIYTKDKSESFAINIARDKEAGIVLKESAEKMKKISDQFPEINIAKVLDIALLQSPSLLSQVVITRNEWVDNSYEVHLRKNKLTGEDELLMVERFITDSNNPACITSVLGRLFTMEEVITIQNGIDEFTTKVTACLKERPQININYGDVVWDGEKATIVAFS